MVSILGVGISSIGRNLMKSPRVLSEEAISSALEDAQLSPSSIDSLFTTPVFSVSKKVGPDAEKWGTSSCFASSHALASHIGLFSASDSRSQIVCKTIDTGRLMVPFLD